MKRVDYSRISNAIGLRFKSGTLEVLQDGNMEVCQDIIKFLTGVDPSSSAVTVLFGCVNSGAGSTYNISAGAVYYLGEVYRVPAANFAVAGSNVPVANIVITSITDSRHDPVTLTTNVAINAHLDRTIVISSGVSGSGIADYSSFSNGASVTRTSINNGLSVVVNITASAPFAYTNLVTRYSYTKKDGICRLHFKISFDVSDGAVVDQIKLPLPDGIVKSIVGGEDYSFRGYASFSAPGSTTNFAYLSVNAVDDGTEGQRFVLRRFDGTTDITISTATTVTVRGSVDIPLV